MRLSGHPIESIGYTVFISRYISSVVIIGHHRNVAQSAAVLFADLGKWHFPVTIVMRDPSIRGQNYTTCNMTVYVR